jgi:hypothetical protein
MGREKNTPSALAAEGVAIIVIYAFYFPNRV